MADVPNRIHGDLVGQTQAYCDLCKAFKPLTHFEASPFIEDHPDTARGVSARDLREWKRGRGSDGNSSHRAMRWQVSRRGQTTLKLALARRGEGKGLDGVIDLILATRPNILDELAKGIQVRL